MLLWCGFFFLALTVENVMLFVDLVLVPQIDLSITRTFVALMGTALLLFGMIWRTK
jgi:hypothetical protein